MASLRPQLTGCASSAWTSPAARCSAARIVPESVRRSRRITESATARVDEVPDMHAMSSKELRNTLAAAYLAQGTAEPQLPEGAGYLAQLGHEVRAEARLMAWRRTVGAVVSVEKCECGRLPTECAADLDFEPASPGNAPSPSSASSAPSTAPPWNGSSPAHRRGGNRGGDRAAGRAPGGDLRQQRQDGAGVGPGHRPTVGAPFTGHTGYVDAVATTQLDGRPVVISGSVDKTVRVWDLATGQPVGAPFTGHTDWVREVATTQLNGRPVVISSSTDNTVRVWDLATGKPVGAPFTVNTDWVTAVATKQLDGRPVVIFGSGDKTVRVWDLATGKPIGDPFTGHTHTVNAVATARLNGRPRLDVSKAKPRSADELTSGGGV